MIASSRIRRGNPRSVAVVCVMLLLLVVCLPGSYGESLKPPRSPREILTLGERMYRDGILPSGEAVQAFVKEDLPVAGTAFSCESCHMRSGLGSLEGGVVTPPTNGASLFQPYRVLFKGLEQKYFPFPPRRPAYNETSLAEVIRSGTSPAGGVLNDVMPRYLLENEDMAILITYLKSLSARFSPGVSDTTLRFATVITDDVSQEDRDAMLANMERYIHIKNSQAKTYQSPGSRSRQMAENMLVSKELATRTLTLSRWVLKGPSQTWRSQLEEYYRKEPVFALLGGIAKGEWRVIHQFSEDNRIPCIFPQTDFPVISATDWYTLYPSKGFYQEGEAAARYLSSREDIAADRPIVELVRDSREGEALSAGFEQTWRDTGHQDVQTIRLKADEKITASFIKQLLVTVKPAAILLWDGSATPPALELLAAAADKPKLVFVSSRYLGTGLRMLPEQAREFTYITFPYSFARKVIKSSMGSIEVEDDEQWSIPLADIAVHDRAHNIPKLSNSTIQLITMALMDMRGNYYRDNLLDVISMVPDQPSPVYARLSFGPGQRYASKGCYIVQLGNGSQPEIIRKSAWVIH